MPKLPPGAFIACTCITYNHMMFSSESALYKPPDTVQREHPSLLTAKAKLSRIHATYIL